MATSPEFDALLVAVTAKHTIDDGVIAFLTGLVPILAAVAGDRAGTLAVIDTIKAKGDEVSAALAANVPAAPAGPVVPAGDAAPVV